MNRRLVLSFAAGAVGAFATRALSSQPRYGTRMHYILVHSPFLGPSVWGPLRSVLVSRGHDVLVPDLRDALSDTPDPYAALGRQASNGARADSTVVMHSGAGALAPSIWTADKRLKRMIFLDALLPHPGKTWLETLPKGMAEQLLAASAGNRLPPWPSWLPKGALEQLVPDGRLRIEISTEAVGVALSYVAAKAPYVHGWEQALVGQYVQLSDGYAEEAQKAIGMKFSVYRLNGTHLSVVTIPAPIADLLVASA